jgi:hypothetical protein
MPAISMDHFSLEAPASRLASKAAWIVSLTIFSFATGASAAAHQLHHSQRNSNAITSKN